MRLSIIPCSRLCAIHTNHVVCASSSQHWDVLACVPMDGFMQYTKGLIFGLRDMLHVSWGTDLEEMEEITVCRLTSMREGKVVLAAPEVLQFYLSHTTSDLHANR